MVDEGVEATYCLTTDGPLAELHRFAQRIGIQRSLAHLPTLTRRAHYDLTADQRKAALSAGAVVVPASQQAAEVQERERLAPGAPFAPSVKLLLDAKAGRLADTEYDTLYHKEMQRSYGEHRAAWNAVLQLPKVVLVCFCPDYFECHRKLLAGYLEAAAGRKAVYRGEVGVVEVERRVREIIAKKCKVTPLDLISAIEAAGAETAGALLHLERAEVLRAGLCKSLQADGLRALVAKAKRQQSAPSAETQKEVSMPLFHGA